RRRRRPQRRHQEPLAERRSISRGFDASIPSLTPSAGKPMPQVDKIIAELDRLQKSGAPFEDLLKAAVHGLHELDPRFHWTGIYELFPDNVLRLGPFIGAPTDHVFIGVGRGVCGTAVAERRNINVPDVSKAQNYLACSASTRSELVVLIRKGDRVFA